MVKPFLRWAGGKRSLLSQIEPHLPLALFTGQITTYIEPFIGSGALYFHLLNLGLDLNYIIADLNYDLIKTYRIIKTHPHELIAKLQEFEISYTNKFTIEAKEDFYNNVKLDYNINFTHASTNRLKIEDNTNYWINRAAQFIILNKLGFNGLYMVNTEGRYNTPFGKKENFKIDYENLINISLVLQNTTIIWGSFFNIITTADHKTLIYLDPPYRPVNSKKSFNKYTSTGFGSIDLDKLLHCFNTWNDYGAFIMFSNSKSQDSYFEDNINNCNIHTLWEKRTISAKTDSRGTTPEVLITNY